MPKSKSSSSTSQQEISQTATPSQSAGIGSHGNTAVSLANTSGTTATVNLNGLSADDTADLLSAITNGTSQIIGNTASEVHAADQQTLQTAISGQQGSETGRLIKSLAVPVLVLAALWLFFTRRRQ